MARFALTDRYVHNAKARGGRAEYFDENTRGLALRVSPAAKSWCFHYTTGGVRKRLKLGTYPATSLSKARTLATEARGLLEAGKDPSAVRAASKNTLKAICDEYLKREGSKLRTAQERLRVFNRLVYPTLGAMQIDAIKRTDIVRLLDGIEDENGPVMADKTLAFLSKLFSWHASRSDEFRSPIVRGMTRTKPQERTRSRILSDEELRAIWRATGEYSHPFGPMLRFILLTATRRNEAVYAKRSEITDTEWTIPAARYKTKLDHLIPLSDMAVAQTRAGPLNLGVTTQSANAFIFTTNGKAIGGLGRHKRAIDEASGVTGWWTHDLRRTARSLMSRAGVPSDHAERCLGHVIGGVRGVYDRHEYLEEKRRAFEALAAQIERIVNPQDNVVPMRG